MNLENEIINTSNIMDVYEHCKCLLDCNMIQHFVMLVIMDF